MNKAKLKAFLHRNDTYIDTAQIIGTFATIAAFLLALFVFPSALNSPTEDQVIESLLTTIEMQLLPQQQITQDSISHSVIYDMNYQQSEIVRMRSMIRRDSSNLAIYDGLAYRFLLSERQDSAITYWTMAFEKAPDTSAYMYLNNIAFVNHLLGRAANALLFIDSAVALARTMHPMNLNVLYNYGIALMSVRAYDSAIIVFNNTIYLADSLKNYGLARTAINSRVSAFRMRRALGHLNNPVPDNILNDE